MHSLSPLYEAQRRRLHAHREQPAAPPLLRSHPAHGLPAKRVCPSAVDCIADNSAPLAPPPLCRHTARNPHTSGDVCVCVCAPSWHVPFCPVSQQSQPRPLPPSPRRRCGSLFPAAAALRGSSMIRNGPTPHLPQQNASIRRVARKSPRLVCKCVKEDTPPLCSGGGGRTVLPPRMHGRQHDVNRKAVCGGQPPASPAR